MLATLKQIREHIQNRGIGITIHDLKKLCSVNHLGRVLNDIESVENDYELLTRFFASGFEDAEREKLYRKLECRTYNIILGLLADCAADQNPTFKQCRTNALSFPFEYSTIEETLSKYDQELALASLDANADEKQKNIHQRLFQYRIFLFNNIYTSRPWSQSEAETMIQVLLSPLVDVIDQQIILGAILMAQRTVFDAWKFHTLCEVVNKTDNIYVRERALVGIALALPDDIDRYVSAEIIDNALETLFSVDGIEQDITDLQTQLLLCMETASNERTINNDILPTLMKNSQQMMNNLETDEAKLDSLLHPDIDEKRMEEVEASIDRMRNMQKNGADIFFSSFSQAKRFSFFYTPMNWFCPFYIEHPQVATMNFKDLPTAFLDKIVVGEMFCNSDKYSFILSLAHVINQIPKDMLELMQKGEVSPMFEEKATETNAFVRRSYLNDLYRFFNLYSDKGSFRNPFASDESVCFFLNDVFLNHFLDTPYALRVCRQLLKHRCFSALDRMLVRYANDDEIEWLKLLAINNEHKGDFVKALTFFRIALEKAPENRLLLSRTANAAFLAGRFDDALEYYQRYADLAVEGDDIEVEEYRMSLCEFQTDRIDDGMKRLFRLSYNDPQNTIYRSSLAWGYLKQKKYSDALTTYESLDKPEVLDVLRLAIAQWMNRHIEDAVATLKRYIDLSADDKSGNVLDHVAEQLSELHLLSLYKTEAMILIDLALKDKY